MQLVIIHFFERFNHYESTHKFIDFFLQKLLEITGMNH